VYRFLLTPRWLGIIAAALAAAYVMVLLGNWQHGRYELRHAVNARIDAAATAPPAPLPSVAPAPFAGLPAGTAGPAPDPSTSWRRVTVTGRYDPTNLVLVRARTVNRQVGFEIVAPLVLADGSAVLVDRGWVPPAPGGAMMQPTVPPTPSGEVTVTGLLRLPESRGTDVTRREGRLETRRIAVARIAAALPYPVFGGFVQLDGQTPPADPAFVPVPADRENDWLNGGYAVQWWLFAGMTLVALAWLARREARNRAAPTEPTEPADGGTPPAQARPTTPH
jgi:cytochrome oxidase assembly protein ShyY1